MPTLAQIKDMLSAAPVGGGRGFVNPPMARRKPLVMPRGMEDQSPEDQIREAKRIRDMGESYDEATVKRAKGGSIDGCCQRGKTRGKVV